MKKIILLLGLLLAVAGGVWAQQGNQVLPTGGGSGANSTSSTFGGSPSNAYTFSVVSGTVYATNNKTGAVDYSGSDLAPVFTSVTTALATTGGRLFFKNGVYPINSLVEETTTGCATSFEGSGAKLAYALPFPSNTPFYKSVQWLIDGESSPVWMGEAAQTTANTGGVILNITATGVSSVTAGDVLAGFWQRPVTNCTLTSSNVVNDVRFTNVGVRYPLNTRGNECAFCMYFTNTVGYANTLADFAQPYNTIATGAAPTVGSWNSIAYTTSVSSAGNVMSFEQTYAAGWNLPYDFQSEHINGHLVTAIYSNIACEFGRSGTAVFHPSKIVHFVDQENAAGCIFGPQMSQGSMVDVDFDFEFGNDANWYTAPRAKTAKLSETNSGYGTGIIRYQAVVAGAGVSAEIPAATLFTSGGSNFTFFEATTSTNISILPDTENFLGPNAATIGPAWALVNTGAPCTFAVTGHTATWGGAAATCLWVPQKCTTDQFSKITIGASDANGIEPIVRGSTSALTYYDYLCVPGTGRSIRKRVAGTFTTLAGPTASTVCGAASTMELDVVGTSLFAYFNGALDMTAVDAAIAAGFPGFTLGGSGDTVSLWSGGSMPTFNQTTTSIYNHPFIAPTYSTLTNCAVNSVSPAACGSAAAGAFVIPTTTTTYTVNTTAVTANSVIILTPRTYTGNLPSAPTCVVPTITAEPVISAIVAGTSFTLTETSTTGQTCWNYWISN